MFSGGGVLKIGENSIVSLNILIQDVKLDSLRYKVVKGNVVETCLKIHKMVLYIYNEQLIDS